MASVYTDLGPGEVTETKTVRGRTEYRVAAHDGSFDMWLPATKIGFADVDHDNSVNLPYNPEPQYGVGALTDATIQPIHEINPDKRLHPADSLSFDSRDESEGGSEPGPAAHLFAAGINIDMSGGSSNLPYGAGGIQQGADDAHTDWMAQHGGPQGDAWEHESPHYQGTGPSQDYMDHHGTDGWLPQDSEPHDTPPDDWHPSDEYGDLNQPYPADTWRGQDAEMNRFGGYRQADVLEGAPTRFEPDMIVNDTDDEFLHDQDVEKDERETTGPDGIMHFANQQRHGWAAAIPAVAEAIGPTVARGVAGHEIGNMLGGDEDPGQNAGTPQAGGDAIGNAMDQVAPDGKPLPIPGLEGTGWGDLTTKHGYTEHEAVDWRGMYDRMTSDPMAEEGGYQAVPAHEWLQGHGEPAEHDRDFVHAGLDSRYADIIAAHDPNDKVAQFRHDPEAFINRVGHSEFEGLNPRMASYIDTVEADAQLRTAAWKDVREKAVRLRREGRVHVKDVGPDRIYASVQGDHGVYDVMIKKGNNYAGLGSHAVSNWHCSCEWGKWAFQRRFTMVGRLCSHGYASYMEMQSNHLKGVQQKKRRVNPRNARVASDQTESDWTVDGNVPASELNQLRNWAEQDHDTWNGSQADHVDKVQDVVQRARDEGVDADQLVASLHKRADDLGDLMSGRPHEQAVNPFGPGGGIGPNIGAPSQGAPTSPGAGRGPVGQSPLGDMLNGVRPGDTQGIGNSGLSSLSNPLGVQPTGIGTGIDGKGPAGSAGNAPAGTSGQPSSPGSGGTTAPTSAPGGGSGGWFGGQGGSSSGGGGSIGQGDYKINAGDTLSDIAQRSGYGSDYKALGDANGIKDYDKINAGDTIKIGDPKASGQSQQAGSQPSAPSQTPGDGQSSPAATATPSPAAPASSSSGVDTSAVPAVGGGSGGTSSPSQISTPNMDSDIGTTGPSSAAGGSGGGPGGQSADAGSPASAAAMNTDTTNKTSALQLEADRDWFEAAYPDQVWHEHKPFNGSGGQNVTEWGSSKENVKDNYSDNLQDVTAEPSGSYLTDTDPLNQMRKGNDPVTASVSGGIKRAGHGPQRQPVEPVVIRERKPHRQGAVAVEAEHIPDEFDPLAPRTAASFDDPYADQSADARAVMAAANMSSGDIVAQFQASGGGAVFEAANEGGGQYDDFASSPAVRQAMQRTAGRNYSLAEQDALVREGEKGGAGNLNQLQLAGTHYEAMNSVGLW